MDTVRVIERLASSLQRPQESGDRQYIRVSE